MGGLAAMYSARCLICLAALLLPVVTGQKVVIQDVRLSDGNATAGRVEVLVDGSWGTVCDDKWDELDARVVCRQLSLSGGVALKRAAYGQGQGEVLMDDVSCAGNEASLDQCDFSTGANANCDHSEDAAVVCLPAGSQPTVTPVTTTRQPGVTLPDRCATGAGSSSVRLVGLPSQPGMGYVQVQAPNGTFGYVCDDFWDINAAKVVCAELCYNVSLTQTGLNSSSAVSVSDPVFALDDVQCVGVEGSIRDCAHDSWFTHNCAITELAAVTCVSITYPTPPPPNPNLQCRDGDLIALFSKARDEFLEPKFLSVADLTPPCPRFRIDDSDPNFITAKIPFDSCGTKVYQNATHIVYSNAILMKSTSSVSGISNVNDYYIKLTCEMPRSADVSKGVEPLTETVTQTTLGKFVINMTIYQDQYFNQPATAYPVQLNRGSWVNAAVQLESIDQRLKLVVTDCVASPNSSQSSAPNKKLLADKCPFEDSTMQVFPLSKVKVGLRFQSFVFVSYPFLVVECSAIVCLTSEVTSECDRSCNNAKPTSPPSTGRRRRDVMVETHKDKADKTRYVVRSQPFFVIEIPNNSSTVPYTSTTKRSSAVTTSTQSPTSTTMMMKATMKSTRPTSPGATSVSPGAGSGGVTTSSPTPIVVSVRATAATAPATTSTTTTTTPSPTTTTTTPSPTTTTTTPSPTTTTTTPSPTTTTTTTTIAKSTITPKPVATPKPVTTPKPPTTTTSKPPTTATSQPGSLQASEFIVNDNNAAPAHLAQPLVVMAMALVIGLVMAKL